MRIKEEQQALMSTFMTDFWTFQKCFWNPDTSQDYWDRLVEGANAMSRKYRHKSNDPVFNNYVSELLVSFVSSRDKMIPGQRSGEKRGEAAS